MRHNNATDPVIYTIHRTSGMGIACNTHDISLPKAMFYLFFIYAYQTS